jgi:hypothetical protein
LKLSAILGPLLDAKADHELLRSMILAHETAQADALEKRRETDRLRQAAKAERDRLSRESREPYDGVSSHVRVEDSSSKKDNNKEEKKEGRSQATRLPADWTIPEDWLQEAINAGLSRSQALASATRMHRWSMSEQKGKKLNWHATWQNWYERDLPKPHSTASPQQPRNAGERAMLKLRNGMIDHEPPSLPNGRLDPSDGRRQIEGNGDAWPVAGAQGAFGRN